MPMPCIAEGGESEQTRTTSEAMSLYNGRRVTKCCRGLRERISRRRAEASVPASKDSTRTYDAGCSPWRERQAQANGERSSGRAEDEGMSRRHGAGATGEAGFGWLQDAHEGEEPAAGMVATLTLG